MKALHAIGCPAKWYTRVQKIYTGALPKAALAWFFTRELAKRTAKEVRRLNEGELAALLAAVFSAGMLTGAILSKTMKKLRVLMGIATLISTSIFFYQIFRNKKQK